MNYPQKLGSLKYMKRAGIYKAANVTFNPQTCEAFSFSWWRFVAKINGKLVFNNYRYSATTSKHQSRVREVLRELGIKIDVSLSLPKGINSNSMVELRRAHASNAKREANLQEQKRIERNKKSKFRRASKKLESYLENQVAFRDYNIEPVERFGKLSKIAVHQVVNLKEMQHDVENALHSFSRDGFGCVVFYV